MAVKTELIFVNSHQLYLGQIQLPKTLNSLKNMKLLKTYN